MSDADPPTRGELRSRAAAAAVTAATTTTFRYTTTCRYGTWAWPAADARVVTDGLALCRRGQHAWGVHGYCHRYRVGADGGVGLCGHRRKRTRRWRKALAAAWRGW